MAHLLAFDTSTRRASVALVSEAGDLVAAACEQVSAHSDRLLAMVDQVLAEGRSSVANLAAIACGKGPGSFTGLRIGLGTAKGLCLASEKPLILISSLEALAAEGEPSGLSVPCMDALKGELFVAAYHQGMPVHPEACIRPAELAPALASLLRQTGVPNATLVGNAVERYPELGALGTWKIGVPQALYIAQLAQRRHSLGESDDLATSTPAYIRAPDITDPRKIA